MAIRIDITQTPRERVAVVASPLLETILSLHVLADPSHHALHHPWVRRMRRAPLWLRRELAAFAPAFALPLPAFALPAGDEREPRFEDELAELRRADAEVVAHELHAGSAEDGMRFVSFLSAYWNAAFALEWQRVECGLATAVSESCARLRAAGLRGAVEATSPLVRVAGGEIVVTAADAGEVALGPDDRLVLSPSAFVWPHVLVEAARPGVVVLVYPAPSVAAGAKPPFPPGELMKVLRALADDTRMQALSLIAQQPRSTQELARLIGITEGTLSRHLRQLVEAGLLTSRREGYYVLYAIDPKRLGWLAEALPQFVGASRDGSGIRLNAAVGFRMQPRS
jgi:DNA-binding transcriptional ArsR family regulator